jgi:hypothetical protein
VTCSNQEIWMGLSSSFLFSLLLLFKVFQRSAIGCWRIIDLSKYWKGLDRDRERRLGISYRWQDGMCVPRLQVCSCNSWGSHMDIRRLSLSLWLQWCLSRQTSCPVKELSVKQLQQRSIISIFNGQLVSRETFYWPCWTKRRNIIAYRL